jgi:large subunit ribosomal protein L47
MYAFWKVKNIPKKYSQYPNITNPSTDLSSLTGDYFKNKMVNEDVVSGRPWKPVELRLKSTAELHKLWFVLLKEKLALSSDLYYATQKHFHQNFVKRDLDKVILSMNRVKAVMGERDKLRNDFMLFLEFWFIRKSQNQERAKTGKYIKPKSTAVGASNKDKLLSIEDSNSKAKANEGLVNKKEDTEEGISVLTEKEIQTVEKLKKKYKNKSSLIRDHVYNPEGIAGKQKRVLYNIIQVERQKQAKTIFLKELSAVSYKLKKEKSDVIKKLEDI